MGNYDIVRNNDMNCVRKNQLQKSRKNPIELNSKNQDRTLKNAFNVFLGTP